MAKVETIAEGVTLYLGDCREILPTLGNSGGIVTDPPYGMNWDANHQRFTGGEGGQRRRKWEKIENDEQTFDPLPLLRFKEAIIFGCNHFGQFLPTGTTLVWIKKSDAAFGSFLSDAELAWKMGGHGVYCHRDMSIQGESANRLHPTQKPVGLMKWCIEKIKSNMIIDPFMGSGTTGAAAINMGRKFVGIEIEQKYFDIACRRISGATKQQDLFIEKPKPTQLGLLTPDKQTLE